MKTPSPKQSEAARLVAAGKFYPDLVREEDGWHARWFALADGRSRDVAVDSWVDEYVRAANVTRLSEDAEDQRHETLHDAWLMALRSRTGLVRWAEPECAAFAAELREWHGAAVEEVAARRRIVFRFVPGTLGVSVFIRIFRFFGVPVPGCFGLLRCLGLLRRFSLFGRHQFLRFRRQGHFRLSVRRSGRRRRYAFHRQL